MVRTKRLDVSKMAVLLLGGVLPWVPGTAMAQAASARVTVTENFRAEPQGVVIARLQPGTVLSVVSEEGPWIQARLEGWMWTPSLMATSREGFDLEVGVRDGENLRAEPQGTILARFWRGALLEDMEEIDGWHRVRRVAWVWSESVEVTLESGSAAPTPLGRDASADLEGWLPSPLGGAAVLSGPDGDTLAQARAGTELEVVSRQGNWARVRLEGWVWDPTGERTSDSVRAPTRANATPAEVARNPDGFRGRVVSWNLQFISLERAERIRTDFYEGEPFLLARSTAGNLFVYIAVPQERLSEVEGLIPLESIRVVGRVRTGSAALTGNPILDLVEFTRSGRDRPSRR